MQAVRTSCELTSDKAYRFRETIYIGNGTPRDIEVRFDRGKYLTLQIDHPVMDDYYTYQFREEEPEKPATACSMKAWKYTPSKIEGEDGELRRLHKRQRPTNKLSRLRYPRRSDEDR